MASESVVFVEADGKVNNISRIFNSLGLDAEVIATQGRLLDLPLSLNGKTLLEHNIDWEPVNPFKYNRVINKLSEFKKGIILTDMDREGEWCAYELEKLSKIHKCALKRINSSDLSKAGLISALSKPVPVNLELAAEAIAHRIVSRLTSPANNERTSIGKVVSPFLSVVNNLPCKISAIAIENISAIPQIVIIENLENPSTVNISSIDRLVEIEEEAGVTIDDVYISQATKEKVSMKEVYDTLQKAYMEGVITYPRTSNCYKNNSTYPHEPLSMSERGYDRYYCDAIILDLSRLINAKALHPNNTQVDCTISDGRNKHKLCIKANAKLMNKDIRCRLINLNKEAYCFLTLCNNNLATPGSYHHHFTRFPQLLTKDFNLNRKGLIALQKATYLNPNLLNISFVQSMDEAISKKYSDKLHENIVFKIEAALKNVNSKSKITLERTIKGLAE